MAPVLTHVKNRRNRLTVIKKAGNSPARARLLRPASYCARHRRHL